MDVHKAEFSLDEFDDLEAGYDDHNAFHHTYFLVIGALRIENITRSQMEALRQLIQIELDENREA